MGKATSKFAALSAKHERALRAKYGSLLTIKDVTQVLRYASDNAVRQARFRGSLPVPMVQVPPRANWFAPVTGVAELLAKLDLEAKATKEVNMT